MKKYAKIIRLLLFVAIPTLCYSQKKNIKGYNEEVEITEQTYSAENPEITAEQYKSIEKNCAVNAAIYGIDVSEKNVKTTLLSWPVQAAATLTDCSFYYISAYVDENTTSGVYQDYNCGTRSYDGHHGTDIAIGPFGFYKMDHSSVEIIAAAPGIILDKHDGEYDRNCASTTVSANYVIIQHSDGSRALYWHMKQGSVTSKAIGQAVSTGEYLGCVGSSGSSSGPHLHFEIWTGSSNTTYIDPYFGSCNLLNASSWWVAQKPYSEPAVIKASVHTTDIVLPGCPTTETPNESTLYEIPFQGAGLAPGYAKFYSFFRNTTVGINAEMKILNPNGTTFNSWTYNPSSNYNSSYAGYSKLLPTIPGTYTFQTTYNGVACAQTFDIATATNVSENIFSSELLVSPNPSNNAITVKVPDQLAFSNYSLILYSSTGEKIIEYPENSGEEIFLTIQDLNPSLYLIVFISNQAILKTKFLKN